MSRSLVPQRPQVARHELAPTLATAGPPLVVIVSAIAVHVLLGGGAVGFTKVAEKLAKERAEIRGMVADVRGHFDLLYVESLGDGQKPKKEKEEDPHKSTDDWVALMSALGEWAADPATLELPKTPPTELEKEEKQDQPKAKQEEKEDEPKEEKKNEPPEDKPELVIMKDNRISIRQVNETEQKDNPNAPRLAEKALTVENETVAKIVSTDTVSKNPTPGSNQRGPTNEEGNSDKTKIAQGEEAPGDEKKAPGENKEKAVDSSHTTKTPSVAPPVAANAPTNSGPPGKAATNPGGPAPSTEKAPTPNSPGSTGGAGPAAPELVTADDGYSEEIPEAAPGGTGVGVIPGAPRPSVVGTDPSVIVPKAPGLGVKGGTAGKISVDWNVFAATFSEQMESQRAAAGQKLRSEHRGRFDTNKFERWLPDIINYDPSVKLGNQTALNAAQSVFATYLSTIHNAIHPIFADEFLGMLNRLARGHELNEHLVTHVEIILSKADGKVMRMGITKQSGNMTFDAAALDAIDRAQPFGIAPDAIASADGNVYLHWEFHRDPVDACSTRNAHPFIVKDPKPLKPSAALKKKPTTKAQKTKEAGASGGKGPTPPSKSAPPKSAADKPKPTVGKGTAAKGPPPPVRKE